MKNYLGLFFLAAMMLFVTACNNDDDGLVIDPGDGDINVADGLYLSLSGGTPSSTAQLSAESVEDEGFASQDRSGFVGGYMYLEAGDYNVVQVTAKEITTTIGGTSEMVTDEGSACDYNDYMVVTTAEGADAFSVASSGLYRVTHDQQTSELVLYQIAQAGLIGNATEAGWSADIVLSGSVDSEGGSWSADDVLLRSGQWKLRFNCRWNLDRRTDPNAGFDASNGYQLFTNFGGSVSDLANGNDGPNIEQTEDAVYTVTLDWDPRDGFALNLEKTGDAPEITFNPNDYQFGVIGDATVNSWDADRNLFHKLEDGVHNWYGVVTFADAGSWKFRTNDAWDFDLGGDLSALSIGGDNIATPGAGSHYIKLSTADEGASWSATVAASGWGVIGAGSPSGDWENDTALMDETFDSEAGITTSSVTGDFSTDDWKFRAGGEWGLNLGGDLGFLNVDGDNLSLDEAGTYKVTLSFDGEIYTGTAEKL